MALGRDNLGIPNGDFIFWARSKNPRGLEISGDFHLEDRGFFIPENFGPKCFGDRDFLGMGIFFSWDGISHQNPPLI